jgi:hypothetical protein
VATGFLARRSSQSGVGRRPNDFADKETAAFVGRIAPRVRDDGGQRLTIDSNFAG